MKHCTSIKARLTKCEFITEEMMLAWDEDVSQRSVSFGGEQGHFITCWLILDEDFGFVWLFHLFVEQLLDDCSDRQTLLNRVIRNKTDNFNKKLNHTWLNKKKTNTFTECEVQPNTFRHSSFLTPRKVKRVQTSVFWYRAPAAVRIWCIVVECERKPCVLHSFSFRI